MEVSREKGHESIADIEKQTTNPAFVETVPAPKTLGAGVSTECPEESATAYNVRLRWPLVFSARL